MIYVDADEKADHATERDVVLVKQLLEKAKIKNYVVGLTSR
jgi:hypothetical protein